MERKEAVQRLSTLTERQREVLGLYCQGLPFKDIGERLVIAPSTARSHMANIYVELDLDLMSAAERRKLLHAVYCPALQGTPLPPPPPGGDEPEPVSDEVERMVDEDARTLAVYRPSPLVPMGQPGDPPPRRPLLWFLAGAVVVALIATGLSLSGWLNHDGAEPAVADITPRVETVPVTVLHTQEIVSEVTRVVTTTLEPPAPTGTPIVVTELVVVTATAAPTATPAEVTEVAGPDDVTEEAEEAEGSTNPFPFFDDFEDGRRPEWDVRVGRPSIINGRLAAATGQLTMAIGDDALTDYTVEFDYWELSPNYIELRVAPDVQYLVVPIWTRWYERIEGEWEETVHDAGNMPDSGRLSIQRDGNTISVFLNSDPIYEYIYDGEVTGGPFVLSFEDEVQIDNFSLTVP